MVLAVIAASYHNCSLGTAWSSLLDGPEISPSSSNLDLKIAMVLMFCRLCWATNFLLMQSLILLVINTWSGTMCGKILDFILIDRQFRCSQSLSNTCWLCGCLLLHLHHLTCTPGCLWLDSHHKAFSLAPTFILLSSCVFILQAGDPCSIWMPVLPLIKVCSCSALGRESWSLHIPSMVYRPKQLLSCFPNLYIQIFLHIRT